MIGKIKLFKKCETPTYANGVFPQGLGPKDVTPITVGTLFYKPKNLNESLSSQNFIRNLPRQEPTDHQNLPHKHFHEHFQHKYGNLLTH